MAEEENKSWGVFSKNSILQARRRFLTRTATDNAEQLLRRSSIPELRKTYHDGKAESSATTTNATPLLDKNGQSYDTMATSSARPSYISEVSMAWHNPNSSQVSSQQTSKRKDNASTKGETVLRPAGGSEKMGTFNGVFIPTTLNVFSILMFIRFGFVLGQGGLLGTSVMLLAAYAINLVTTLSISAVASNGTVRGGGAYYLISRSLGPEFGGSIGLISYLGFVLNTGMTAVGLIDCLMYDFGSEQGIMAKFLIEGKWWQYLWSSIIILFCVVLCLVGSAIFARASNLMMLVLMISVLSIPLSAIIRSPFKHDSSTQYTDFTGWRWSTLIENWKPHLTQGAAGSQMSGRETYQDLFGVLFPATGGIFAGASMSGDLKNPSKSIPRGTLYGILLTFCSYFAVLLSMAASVTRSTLYRNSNVIQDTNFSGILILLGELATSIFSVLMGIIGPAKQLQAISRDGIIPGLGWFGQGTKKSDDPIYAVLFTWALAQVTILFDVNSLASLVTMAYLMISLSLHLACLLLKLSAAPNFRPSFHFFNEWTALVGAVLSIGSMIFVDRLLAVGAVVVLMLIFILIHYTTPPKPWGADVTSGLVYHQIRKYLLRLKTEHVKYWRPQILLFVNDPRRGYKLVQFANSLKKGGLFILGHVIVTDNFGASVPEARRQQAAWTKYIECMRLKSFVNVAISPSIEWGARNIVLSAGLGGMRPNIVMMGFYNLQQFRQEQPLVDVPSPPPERKRKKTRRRSFGDVKGSLPTDTCYVEKRTDIQSYVLVLEDMILKLQTNVAVAVGFTDLEFPTAKGRNSRKYIDLWPIQMSAEIASDQEGMTRSILTTNFDTYTMILQLGCILNTVKAWKKSFRLRVAVFVEYESDVEEERSRVTSLLESLRIEAEIMVFWLACGDLKSYQLIVNGEDVDEESEDQINKILEDEKWWAELRQVRGKLKSGDMDNNDVISLAAEDESAWPSRSLSQGRENPIVQYEGLRRILQGSKYRPTFGNLSRLGVSFSIRTHRLDDELLSRHASHHSNSRPSSTDDDSDVDSDLNQSYASQEELNDMETSSAGQVKDTNQRTGSNTDQQRKSSIKSSEASSKKSKESRKHRISPRRAMMEERVSANTLDRVVTSNYDADAESQNSRGRSLHRNAGDHHHQQQQKQEQEQHNSDTIRSRSISSPSQSLTVEGKIKFHPRISSPNFTSQTVPITRISNEEGPGPSIMFADSPHPRHRDETINLEGFTTNNDNNITSKTDVDTPNRTVKSIYQRPTTGDDDSNNNDNNNSSSSNNANENPTKPTAKTPAQGFPSAASMPLSFNDLPGRAQHLILNELMLQSSDETAVIFTTLPAPEEGTYKNETDSLTYLTDLEVLTQGLGPVLLVHSNSMTVTTNL